MSDQEDDSSSAEENYTETETLLGYASTKPTDDRISQLGGRPVSSSSTSIATTMRSCNTIRFGSWKVSNYDRLGWILPTLPLARTHDVGRARVS